MKNSLEIQYLPIAAVRPSPHAARQHSGAQQRKLKSLIEKFGQVAPIIVDASKTIVDGHAVYDAVHALGHDEIAVVIVHNRNGAEIRALRLALNRISEETKWENGKLKSEFEALLTLGFELDVNKNPRLWYQLATMRVEDVVKRGVGVGEGGGGGGGVEIK